MRRGRGWRGLAMGAMAAVQSVQAFDCSAGKAGRVGGCYALNPGVRADSRTRNRRLEWRSIKGAAPVRAAGTVEIRSASSPSERRGAQVREHVHRRTATVIRGIR